MRYLALLILTACSTASADDPACEPSRVVLYVRARLDGTVCEVPIDPAHTCCPDGFDAVGLDGANQTICVGY